MEKNYPIQNVKLTVEKNPSHIYNHYGMYLVGTAPNPTQETKKEIDKLIFDLLHTKIFHFTFSLAYPSWHRIIAELPADKDHFDVDDNASLDAWIEKECSVWAYGGIELIKNIKAHGGVLAMNFSEIEKYHLASESVERMYADASPEELNLIMGDAANEIMVRTDLHQIDDDYVPVYVDKAVKVIHRMITHFDFPVKYVSIIDEPNIHGITPQQCCRLYRLLREKLDAAGLEEVLLNGPALAGINLAYAKSMVTIDPQIFDIIQNTTIHGFGSGFMDLAKREDARKLGRDLWITSTGADAGIVYSELPKDENGCVFDNWDFGGVINASTVLVDVNLGASYMGMWVALNNTSRAYNLPYRYHMLLVDDESGYPSLGKELLKLRSYDYLTTISATFDNDAEIYYCESSDEGCMTERYDLTNIVKNQMAAVVGKNKNGKWAISILNKTDSETRKIQKSKLNENTKTHSLVGPSVTLAVELEIPALYGTGEKHFSVAVTGKNGKYLEPGKDLIIVDGKGTVYANPFELLCIRER